MGLRSVGGQASHLSRCTYFYLQMEARGEGLTHPPTPPGSLCSPGTSPVHRQSTVTRAVSLRAPLSSPGPDVQHCLLLEMGVTGFSWIFTAAFIFKKQRPTRGIRSQQQREECWA